jgi:hypothetical protein
MLIDAPRGKMKLVTLFDTPQFLFTEYMVNGRVVTDDAVKQDVIRAARMFLKCFQGLVLNPKYRNKGNVITA